jgi:hypothetical protein
VHIVSEVRFKNNGCEIMDEFWRCTGMEGRAIRGDNNLNRLTGNVR